jgi:thiamine-monophosphate kinase
VARTEDELIGWLRRRASGAGGERIGDDAALLPAGGPWALTTDTQIEGVHFLPGTDPRLVARRLLAVNLSDLAAVGAEPRFALAALATPAGFAHRRFLGALVAACRRHRVELVGGDLARSPVATAVLTLAGVRPPGGRWLRRGAARPGDALWLGGDVGWAAAGLELVRRGGGIERGRLVLPPSLSGDRRLAAAARRALSRHLLPAPQLELGAWLGRQRRAAAIDVSDGLSLDLGRLCRASDVGATVDADPLAADPALARLARRLDRDPLALALGGGEDYVLLFTLAPPVEPPAHFACRRIGVIDRGAGLRLSADGSVRPLAQRGWDHLAGPAAG